MLVNCSDARQNIQLMMFTEIQKNVKSMFAMTLKQKELTLL